MSAGSRATLRSGLIAVLATALPATALLAVGCAEQPCRPHTVLATFDLTAVTGVATTLDVEIVIASGAAKGSTIAAPTNGARGTFEIDFPGGYPEGEQIEVRVEEKDPTGATVASGSQAATLAAACSTLTVVLTDVTRCAGSTACNNVTCRDRTSCDPCTGSCVAPCDAARPCVDGAATCCAQLCVDTSTDVSACGACDRACDSATTVGCAAGMCLCRPGYVLSADPSVCVDLDECVTDNGGCSPDADCTNTPGARTCECHSGYYGDGVTCSDYGRVLTGTVRSEVGSGDSVLIAGFIITGPGTLGVVLRALGPTLGDEGFANPLANPTLSVFSGSTSIASNDDWQDDANKAQVAARSLAPAHASESAVFLSLGAGAYTLIVSGVGATTGIGVAEIHADDTVQPRVSNISARCDLQAGGVVGGLVLGGSSTAPGIVVRGLGPSLAAQGVSGALTNPALSLTAHDGTVLATNDDWQDTQAAVLMASGLAPTNPLEAAISTSLAPGSYAATLVGVGGGTGIALLDIYMPGPPPR